jgi:hypothetical protein
MQVNRALPEVSIIESQAIGADLVDMCKIDRVFRGLRHTAGRVN